MKPEIVETSPSEAMRRARETRNPLRKMYFWTLHWAETPYAIPALFALSFIESSVFPVPPDVLLVAICFSVPKAWFRAAFWCTVASVLGGLLGYVIGWGLWEAVGKPIVDFYQGQEVIAKVEIWYEEYGFIGILAAAITPIPYKIFTIASGTMRFSLVQFTIASTIGRGARFFAVAGLIRVFGTKIRPFIEKRFELAMVVFTLLGIAGFLAIRYLK